MKDKLIFFGFFLLSLVSAQVKISDVKNVAGEVTVNQNSILELESKDKALLLPRLSEEAIKSIKPVPGMLVYCTDYNALLVFNGKGWSKVQSENLLVSNVNDDQGNSTAVSDRKFITSTYIRPDFYELEGRPSQNLILKNNDLIYFVAQPYWSGDIL
ncbi:hypothetical protein ACT4R9_00020 [Ornithobacterium rhinotracheale]|uniref:hypothetical protein n=1 Tax=Ornithobacterium rhinotracheale TaxID=28251 RepID=UPI003FA427C0